MDLATYHIPLNEASLKGNFSIPLQKKNITDADYFGQLP